MWCHSSSGNFLEWFSQLYPVIEYNIRNVAARLPGARLCYIPIIPRKWWGKQARSLGNKIYHFIIQTLSRDFGIYVKPLDISKLFKIKCTSSYDYIFNDVNPGFLHRDLTHLNYWGYEVVLRSVVAPIMDLVGARTM